MPIILKPSLLASFLPLRSSIISRLPFSRASAIASASPSSTTSFNIAAIFFVARLFYREETQALKILFLLNAKLSHNTRRDYYLPK